MRAAERARGPDRGRGRRVRAADARAHAAPGPRRPGEGGLQLGGRVRGARAGPRRRRLRALRAQAGAAVRARRRGTVESGPAHVHPELGPFAPPPAARFGAIDADQLARAADRATARERWQVGTPYRGVELPTLLVRALEAPGAPPLGLQDAGRVIAEAYRELGELSAEAAGSLRVRPAGAFRRCELTAATAAEGARFVAALDELCGPAPDAPDAADLAAARAPSCGRVLRRRRGRRAAARVPADFARDEAARGGLRPRLGQARRARAGVLRAPRARAAAGRRLRDADQRGLGVGQRVLGRVLAVLGGAVGGVGVGSPGLALQRAKASAASSLASRQASSTGLQAGSRRSTISSVSGTSSRRDLRSPELIVECPARGVSRTPPADT